jgi:hypothetical protein
VRVSVIVLVATSEVLTVTTEKGIDLVVKEILIRTPRILGSPFPVPRKATRGP